MNITKEQIKALNPCADGYKWYLEHGSEDLKTTLIEVSTTRPEWARWLYVNLMTLAQQRRIAVFSAEKVLQIFEKKYPEDGRPREAIAAAKAVIKNDTPKNRRAAADAAANAAADAANAAADAAAYAAAYAAYAAYAAANAASAAAYAANAANAAAYAADAVADAANAAAYAADAAADAARKEMQKRIILEAVRILDEGERREVK